ncbi:MAG: DNA alkylation repair protein [Chloroflexi bacterium]|nr:DNA alkylation repair protein [Chloroflexota bacterium]
MLKRVYVSPLQFVKDLTEFYSSYADLTFQTDSVKDMNAVHPAYRTPVILNRELESALIPLAKEHPAITLQTADLLWGSPFLEPRQLATCLLGVLPVDFIGPVLERIRKWSSVGENRELVQLLHIRGTETIRQGEPGLWLNTLQEWAASKEDILQIQAVIGVLALVKDSNFDDLPSVFNFLQPLLVDPDPRLTVSLLTVVDELAQRSEKETVFFLKHIIQLSDSPEVSRLIRRSLPFFSPPSQLSLKIFLKEHPESN